MLDYKLCKQLKNAGFLQPIEGDRFVSADGYLDGESYGVLPYFPYLHELIAACDDHFCLFFDGNDWCACDGNPSLQGWENWGFTIQKGSSPEEAVAKLWLELNKKP